MATNTAAFFIFPAIGGKEGGTGFSPGVASGMYPENQPSVIWGQGTPDGDRSPFVNLNKSSLYLSVNQTDDYVAGYMKVDEGGDDADWVELMVSPQTKADTYVATELHGWELNYTATNISGANMVGLNVVLTAAGTAGSWNSALFAKVSMPETKAVNGYFSAAEFEALNENDNVSDWAVVVLNAWNNGAQNGSHSAYMFLRDYGTCDVSNLFWLADHSIATTDGTKLISTGADTALTHYFRVICGSTTMWVGATTTTPA